MEPRPIGPPPCQPVQCKTCILRDNGAHWPVGPEKMAEIYAYTIRGKTHLCHSRPSRGPRKLACRGLRDWQLMIWHRLGIIDEPTDEALAAPMVKHDLCLPINH